MGVLADSLSSKNLIGEASTSGVPVTATATTALVISFTAANISSIPPISVAGYDMPDAGVQDTTPYSPKIMFKKEDLETTLEHPSPFEPILVAVRGRSFPLRSLSLYAPLPSASITSYGPSHLGPSFPPSSAWLASLLRYTKSPGLKLVLSFKASSFRTMCIYVVLRVGMPISAGITAFIPWVSENGVSLLLDLIMVRCAYRMCGISPIQSLLPLSNRAFTPSPKLLFSLSTKPLTCGCLTEAKSWRIFSFSHQSLNGLSLNYFLLSDIISPGRPNLQTMLSHTNFLIWFPVMLTSVTGSLARDGELGNLGIPVSLSLRLYACGPTHRSHGLRKDFLYRTPLITAYRLDLSRTALAFFLFVGSVSSM
ncbi:hypothetical protein Tco_1101170, partial [Tanacetum coccineum]